MFIAACFCSVNPGVCVCECLVESREVGRWMYDVCVYTLASVTINL